VWGDIGPYVPAATHQRCSAPNLWSWKFARKPRRHHGGAQGRH